MDAQPIPKPQVLDPDRGLRDDREHQFTQDHRARAEVLDIALHESCAYADQLWDNLNAMRQYLLDSLAPDPHTATSASTEPTGAAPTGPDDEQGWQSWMTAFAAVTSVLCGPHGDSGFGLGRAREEAQRRRLSTASRGPHRDRADDPAGDQPTDNAAAAAGTTRRAGSMPSETVRETAPPCAPDRGDRRRLARSATTAMLIILALRGLRPRRRPPLERL